MSAENPKSSMDRKVANKIIDFIFKSTGRNTIVCDSDGTIVAAKVESRVGTVHTAAQRMLREGHPHAKVTVAEEEASGGVIKAGINLPICHGEERIGSFGIAGDPDQTEPIALIASRMISQELQEQEVARKLLDHATHMNESITRIVAMVERASSGQATVTRMMEDVIALIDNSRGDIEQTHKVVAAIKSIAIKTQMLAVNARIEAAHAQQFGRGFTVVAGEVGVLSKESEQSTRTIITAQSNLQVSMGKVAAHAKVLVDSTHAQAQITGSISEMVSGLQQVSADLIQMALADTEHRGGH